MIIFCKKNGTRCRLYFHLTYKPVPTLTPTVGRTFIELHAVINVQQSKSSNSLFME